MKTFFKNNMVWMFALVLSIGTMSFKLAERNASLAGSWYTVSSGTINQGSSSSTPPAECNGDAETCALNIEMTDDTAPFPATVDDAINLQNQEKLTIHGEVFRD